MALLKDEINSDVVELLAGALHDQYADFDIDAFTHTVTSRLETLELKDRVSLIADTIAEQLPSDYPAALAIVVQVAKTEIDQWAAWPLCSFVEQHRRSRSLTRGHVDAHKTLVLRIRHPPIPQPAP